MGWIGKGAGDRGRWGLGKIVYPASSRIRAFYALTVRENDQRKLLTGRSVLDVHKIGADKFESEGYYGEFPNVDYPYFCMPVEEDSFIEQFQKDFNLNRTDEPGLSIVIPYPNNELTAGQYIESVISSYFMEIHDGKLEVHVRSGKKTIEITRNNLKAVIEAADESPTFAKSKLLGLLDFCERISRIDIKSDDWNFIKTENGKQAPKITEASFDAEKIEYITESYHNGELLFFVVHLNIQKKGEPESFQNTFRVFIEKDESLEEAQEIFIRDGLTISGQSFLKVKGVRALVLIDAEHSCSQLSELLGDAENPAHTQWLESTKHFRNKYEYGPSTLRLVKFCASKIVRFISQKDESRDENLLEDLFSIPIPGEETDNLPVRKKKKRKRELVDLPEVPDGRRIPAFELDKLLGGFHLKHNTDKKELNGTINIRLAYETLKGNPFSRYNPNDFDLSKTLKDDISIDGCKIIICDENRIHIGELDNGFSLKITGLTPTEI